MHAGETLPSIDDVMRWLAEVPDPEIPVVSVVDLGIVRDVAFDGDTLVVTITPTYSGCPATSVIAFEVEAAIRAKGVDKLRLENKLSPPWSTDWIGPEAREKLRQYGIAPPIDGTAADGRRVARLLGEGNAKVECPRCGSANTAEVSRFGSTPCKAAWRCNDCLEPFDYFKCI